MRFWESTRRLWPAPPGCGRAQRSAFLRLVWDQFLCWSRTPMSFPAGRVWPGRTSFIAGARDQGSIISIRSAMELAT
jgi:hypothetical protein